MRDITAEQRRYLRHELCALFGGRCAYCNARVGLRLGTIDHYMPEVLGGTSDWENLRWACNDCNGRKGGMHPEDWARVMPRPVRHPSRMEQRVRLLQVIAVRQRALLERRA